MYVTTQGVTQTDPRQTQYLHAPPKPEGHTSAPHRRMSRISALSRKANSAATLLVVVAVVVSAGLAVAGRTEANAQAPASVNSFGKAAPFGNPEVAANDEVVALSSSKKSAGYWIVTKRGQVFNYGSAADLGEIPANLVNYIVEITSTNTGKGYWLMAANGNVYTYGDATFAGTPVMQNVTDRTFVSLLPTKSGKGYTLVDSTGGVMTFGDAVAYSTATGQLNGDTIVDAQATPSGKGYVMLSTKGAVYAFGDATFYGAISAGQSTVAATAIAFTDTTRGYWILTDGGSVFPYGDAVSYGTAVQPSPLGAPSVDLAVHNSGNGYWIANGKAKPAAPVRKAVQAKKAGVPATPAQVVAPTPGNGDNAEIWARLRECESHGNYATNTGNGYYGAYQFSAPTWRSMNTGYEFAHLAPPEVQDDAARRLQARSGWGQWPVCSRNAGAYR